MRGDGYRRLVVEGGTLLRVWLPTAPLPKLEKERLPSTWSPSTEYFKKMGWRPRGALMTLGMRRIIIPVGFPILTKVSSMATVSSPVRVAATNKGGDAHLRRRARVEDQAPASVRAAGRA